MSPNIRIGYAPCSSDAAFSHPADYRRFVGYARARGLAFEVARWGEKYDLVVLSGHADISLWRHYSHGRVVYELIDSYLAFPRTDIKACLRGIAKYAFRQHHELQVSFWEAIRNMCRRADAVVCTTDEQRVSILPFCENVHVVLDQHGSVASKVKESYAANSPIRLVWEGLPSNIDQLKTIRRTLFALERRHPLELHVVTDPEGFRFLGKFMKVSSAKIVQSIFPRSQVHAWDKKSFASIVTGCDIALIPIDFRNRGAVGKPANKLGLLWRMGMPVVVSATPAYSRAMQEAGQALVCREDKEWDMKLEELIVDERARRSAGESGRRYALERFDESKINGQWDAVFRSVGFEFSS